MREIDITEECLEFIDKQNDRVSLKFFQLVEVIGEIKVVNSNFLKKLQSTQFYELRIKAGNEYRIVIFAIDHLNFAECTKAVCLCGFQKKGTKDYKKAIKQAEKILEYYLKEK
ncbi:type II toxin-antitoxin system RelE/ParE family toxin [Nonlabens antarcticus]|uniref:type II toxin-antitoxin system RelE/ParE family toxin n=1 Tax=Nonlabens antarcticus TaxID=392714 RepID=UPI001891CF8E|nr:type II toxin-antitoxin system RelE/ParE family toxin [Nonlabens antarcticus]